MLDSRRSATMGQLRTRKSSASTTSTMVVPSWVQAVAGGAEKWGHRWQNSRFETTCSFASDAL